MLFLLMQVLDSVCSIKLRGCWYSSVHGGTEDAPGDLA